MSRNLSPSPLKLLNDYIVANNLNNKILKEKIKFNKVLENPLIEVNDINLDSIFFFTIFRHEKVKYKIKCFPKLKSIETKDLQYIPLSRNQSDKCIEYFIEWLNLINEKNEQSRMVNPTLSTHIDFFKLELEKIFGSSSTIPFNLKEIYIIDTFLTNFKEIISRKDFKLDLRRKSRSHCEQIIQRLPILTKSAILENIASVLSHLLIDSYVSFKDVINELDEELCPVKNHFFQIDEQKSWGSFH